MEDLERSKAFFDGLGFIIDPAFSGEGAACMLVGEHASVMLGRGRCGPSSLTSQWRIRRRTGSRVLRQRQFARRGRHGSAAALAAGGTEADGTEDHGFMYSRSFYDLDGHGWQVMWLDPMAAADGPAAVSASA